jgi:hypothetical protein
MTLALLGALAPYPPPARGAFVCPVTIPNDSQPPPGGGGIAPGSRVTHGNGLLWTILPDDGVWRVDEIALQPDGSFKQKFVWWRRPVNQTVGTVNGVASTEVTFAGELRISGRRLDVASDPLTAATNREGVHVGSTITFPGGGCWEITGTAGEDAMTFTVYMLTPGEPLPNTAMPQGAAGDTLGVQSLDTPWPGVILAVVVVGYLLLLVVDRCRIRRGWAWRVDDCEDAPADEKRRREEAEAQLVALRIPSDGSQR